MSSEEGEDKKGEGGEGDEKYPYGVSCLNHFFSKRIFFLKEKSFISKKTKLMSI